jgi:serine/threonine protein kinase
MSPSLSRDTIIAGRYRLDRLVGQGGMGQVWAATHTATLRTVALKFLRGPTHLQEDLRRRFLREARAASAIKHPNVVQVHDFFELPDTTPVMVMDLLDGETVGQRLAREGALSLKDAADILLPVTSAVGAAHAVGIVHRDLKPDNVFLARSPSGGMDVRVLDFGIAKLMIAEADGAPGVLTNTGTMLGTPCYMSPEQSFGEKDIDHRTDIWAIGVMLYEMLAGVRPVDGDNMGQIVKRLVTEGITPIGVLVPDLPADVAELLGRMLTRDRESRPRDLREVQEILARYTSVQVPSFGLPTSERPDLSDSSPSAKRETPRAVVGGSDPPDPEAKTHASSPQAIGSGPAAAPAGVDTQGAQSISIGKGTRRRGAWVAAAALAVVVAVLGAVRLFGGAPSSKEGPAASVAPAALPPTPSPPAPEPASVALPVTPPPLTAAPATSVSSPEAARRSKTGEKAPKPKLAAPAAPSAPAAPASASAPKRAPAARGGLVDEPPF